MLFFFLSSLPIHSWAPYITFWPTGNLHFANIKMSDKRGGKHYVCIVSNGVLRGLVQGDDQTLDPQRESSKCGPNNRGPLCQKFMYTFKLRGSKPFLKYYKPIQPGGNKRGKCNVKKLWKKIAHISGLNPLNICRGSLCMLSNGNSENFNYCLIFYTKNSKFSHWFLSLNYIFMISPQL